MLVISFQGILDSITNNVGAFTLAGLITLGLGVVGFLLRDVFKDIPVHVRQWLYPTATNTIKIKEILEQFKIKTIPIDEAHYKVDFTLREKTPLPTPTQPLARYITDTYCFSKGRGRELLVVASTTGMGKSQLLYQVYRDFWRRSPFRSNGKLWYGLWEEGFIKTVTKLAEGTESSHPDHPSNIVLLIDSIEEIDSLDHERFYARYKEIRQATNLFKTVILAVRLQSFDSGDELVKGIENTGDASGNTMQPQFITLEKLSDQGVKRMLGITIIREKNVDSNLRNPATQQSSAEGIAELDYLANPCLINLLGATRLMEAHINKHTDPETILRLANFALRKWAIRDLIKLRQRTEKAQGEANIQAVLAIYGAIANRMAVLGRGSLTAKEIDECFTKNDIELSRSMLYRRSLLKRVATKEQAESFALAHPILYTPLLRMALSAHEKAHGLLNTSELEQNIKVPTPPLRPWATTLDSTYGALYYAFKPLLLKRFKAAPMQGLRTPKDWLKCFEDLSTNLTVRLLVGHLLLDERHQPKAYSDFFPQASIEVNIPFFDDSDSFALLPYIQNAIKEIWLPDYPNWNTETLARLRLFSATRYVTDLELAGLPDSSSIRWLHNNRGLVSIGLAGCTIQDPRDLPASDAMLEVLIIDGACITDEVLEAKYTMPSDRMRQLGVKDCPVSESLLRFKGSSFSASIVLDSTRISDQLLFDLCTGCQTEDLRLFNTNIQNGIEAFKGTPMPKKLNIGCTRIDDATLADCFTPNQAITSLNIQALKVDTALLRYAPFPALEELYIDRSAVTDDTLQKVGPLPALQEMGAGSEHITQLGFLAASPRLMKLRLYENQVDPAEYRHLPQGCTIVLWNKTGEVVHSFTI